MKHLTSPSFWECYEKLPFPIQELADRSFEFLKLNLGNPSLHLKKVGKYWSVRIVLRYLALAVEIKEGLLWFWIGTHAEYNKMISVD